MIGDKYATMKRKERRNGRKFPQTVPGGKGNLSGKACVLSTFAWRGQFDKDHRTVVVLSRGVYQNYSPCSTGDWSLVYLCNIRLPLNRDDRQDSQKGTVGHESRVRACHVGGGSYSVKCFQ